MLAFIFTLLGLDEHNICLAVLVTMLSLSPISVSTKAVVAFMARRRLCEYSPSVFAQKLTLKCGVEYYLHLRYFVLQCLMWVVAHSLPRNVRYVAAECLASLHLECCVQGFCLFCVGFFREKKELRALLMHARVMKALPQSRGRGIIITIKTIEAAEMSCLLQSMLNSLATGQAA